MTADLSRRSLVAGGALLATMPAPGMSATPGGDTYREGHVPLADGARLWFWDTGGSGPCVAFHHAGTGSGQLWVNQIAAFAKAGFRAVGHSRRGHIGSSPATAAGGALATDDFVALLDYLRIDRCHVVGQAAGGFVAMDFACGWPDRTASLTLACSLAGVTAPEFLETTRRLLPPGFDDLPAEFRELGPAYRATNPDGVREWSRLTAAATQGRLPAPSTKVSLSWQAIASMRRPCLVIGGDADLYMPPPRVRELAGHMPNARSVILAECGHSPHWERPSAFNATLLQFFGGTMRPQPTGARS